MNSMRILPLDTVEEPLYDLSVEEVLQVPGFGHLKPATLAKWRQLGKGPKFTICGKRAFYSRTLIDLWKRQEADAQEADARERSRKKRPVALQVQNQRGDVREKHRLGGHQTKRERSQSH